MDLARADGVRGELVLRRRVIDGRDAVELLAGGVLLMDSADTSTERALATRALDALGGARRHVVVGGLGLGYTASALLDDPRVARVTVVEIEPALVAWVRGGLVPEQAGLLDDVRLEVVVGDVADVVPRMPPGSVDAVLLDVDNGPGFLAHPANARLYSPAVLSAVAGRLRRPGVLAVWSAGRSAALAETLGSAVGRCTEELVTVRREGRDLQYALYVAPR
ncbi:MAG: MnmC family methyltransferase [Actinomycetota bacterium]